MTQFDEFDFGNDLMERKKSKLFDSERNFANFYEVEKKKETEKSMHSPSNLERIERTKSTSFKF